MTDEQILGHWKEFRDSTRNKLKVNSKEEKNNIDIRPFLEKKKNE